LFARLPFFTCFIARRGIRLLANEKALPAWRIDNDFELHRQGLSITTVSETSSFLTADVGRPAGQVLGRVN
jgi:hypothetical protein